MEDIKVLRVYKNQYKVYDSNGIYIKTIEKNDEKNLRENDWLKGVTCFVVNEKGEVLIEKRADTGLTPQKLDLCSGHLDDNETQTQGMIRELDEELGISREETVRGIKFVSNDIPLKFKSKDKISNFFITFYCLKRDSSDITIQEEEISKYVWLPLEETFELIKSGRTKFPKDYNYSKIFEKVREICLGKNEKEQSESQISNIK